MSNVKMLSQVYSHSVENNEHEMKIAEFLFRKCEPNFNVRLSDGTLLNRTSEPKFTFVINDRKILKKLFSSFNELTVGKAFIEKKIDVEGDIFEFMTLKDSFHAFKFSFKERIVLMARVILFL